jgi:5'-3' exonuclease
MSKIIINCNKPFILIDGSYYIFYRYFATFRWFTFQKKTFDINTITENKEFITAFLKHVSSDFKKIIKRWKTSPENILLCMDCPRSKIWRNDIYTAYKASRIQNINFNGNIFKIFNDYISTLNIEQIYSNRLEADDIIYLIQKKTKEMFTHYKIDQKIIIITNDNDYLQLADENVSIINMQMKDITMRGTQNANIDLLIKALIGDKSDNIPKVASFITKDKALAIASMTIKERTEWLLEKNILQNFNLNMQLISFDNIPEEYIKDFYENNVIQLTRY